MKHFIESIIKSHTVERIWLLAKIEFKLRYYENKLGLVWALIKPLFQMAIYYVAFKIIMEVQIPDYAVYLFVGLIVWGFFVESTTGLMNILKTKKYLYEYTSMSKVEIYLASLISNSIGFSFNLLIVLIAIILKGIPITMNILWVFPVFIMLFLFCFGLAMILSTLSIFVKDIKQIWPLFTMALFWLSPLLFHYENIRIKLPILDYINPMAGIILNTRQAVLFGASPYWDLLLINCLHAVLFFVVGLFMLNKLGGKASEIL